MFDESACISGEDYNVILSKNDESQRLDDKNNGTSLHHEEDSDVTKMLRIFYPNLNVAKDDSNTIVFKEKYYFSYNNAWLTNDNNKLYLQLPQEEENPCFCYRVKLDTTVENDIELVKVYRHTDINIRDFD